MDYLEEAKRVFNIEIEALQTVRDSLDDSFNRILQAITKCKGKVILTGIGKSGHVARKISATMASLGTPAFYLHPAEALHGDLGMVSRNDIVIAISYSGESEEIIRLIANIKAIGATLIGISGKADSTLMKHSDYGQLFPKFREACYMNLAPTSSTTAAMVYGDALAVAASKVYGFTETNFALYHPAGSLGKKMFLKTKDVMTKGKENATIPEGCTLKSAIVEMGSKGLGIITIINPENRIAGVLTDGDLRRQLEKGADIYNLTVDEIMTAKPVVIDQDSMAIEALQILHKKNIPSAPVVDMQQKVVGTIRLQAILSRGIVL